MKFFRRHYHKHSFKIVLTLAVFVILALLSSLRVFDHFELILLDWRFQWRPLQPFSPKIIIVEISDKTLQSLGQWPLPRDFHASLVDVLSSLGAKQVMFDIIFPNPRPSDDVFAYAIRRAGNVYLPVVFRADPSLKKRQFPQANEILSPLVPSLKRAAKGIGHVNIFPDADGKIRRVPLFISYRKRRVPLISLKMFCDYIGLPLKDIRYEKGKLIIGQALKIPVLRGGTLLVNYAGPWEKTFHHYSYVDVLKAFQEKMKGQKPHLDLGIFKDSICFIGLTATGTSDLRAIPLSPNYPMVGLHANVFNNLFLKRFIHRLDQWGNMVVVAVLFWMVLGLTRKIRHVLKALILVAGLILVYTLIAIGFFIKFGLWIDLFYPLCVIVFVYSGVSVYNFFEEVQRRQIMEKELEIAKQIQLSFLPEPIETFDGLEIAARMLAAKYVGGDIYDMRELDTDHFGIFIGDVSGKGVAAALNMARTITIFRMLAKRYLAPKDLIYELNNEMVHQLNPGVFVTATYLVYNRISKKLRLVSAGHGPTLFYEKKKAKIYQISPEEGFPLGLVEGAEFSEEEICLHEGDEVILYTDGVNEARNKKGEELGIEKFLMEMSSKEVFHANERLDQLHNVVKAFSKGAPQHDDCTIVVLRQFVQGDGESVKGTTS